MIQASGLGLRDKVLEVGAGSGYAAAVIGAIAGKVVAIERQPEPSRRRASACAASATTGCEIVEGDGSRGRPSEAPFDAILVAASGSHVPDALTAQLAEGASLVMPIGDPGWVQELVKVTKAPAGELIRENLGGVRFVPLIGEEGWKDAGY